MASKLNRHAGKIEQMRLNGATWRKIAEEMRPIVGDVAPSTFFRWWSARKKRAAKLSRELQLFERIRKADAFYGVSEEKDEVVATDPKVKGFGDTSEHPLKTAAEVRQRLAERGFIEPLRVVHPVPRPVNAPEKVKKIFDFDEAEQSEAPRPL